MLNNIGERRHRCSTPCVIRPDTFYSHIGLAFPIIMIIILEKIVGKTELICTI